MEQGQIIIIFIIFNYLMIKYRNSNNIKLVALVGNYLLLSIALSAYFGISDIITPINSVLVSILAILGIYNLYRKNKRGLLSPIEKRMLYVIYSFIILILTSVVIVVLFLLFGEHLI
ncbi:hypothetical protein [Veillonella sp. ICM51a]|uniref:hypothetical protein n=1 Tax=Veillonella sp. ICM51a TaxID=936591 RepID=UPI00057028EA|nr:hypothetical protein [Veillonella sp. ICM51a]